MFVFEALSVPPQTKMQSRGNDTFMAEKGKQLQSKRKRFQLAALEMYAELQKHCMVILPFISFIVLISAVGGECSI